MTQNSPRIQSLNLRVTFEFQEIESEHVRARNFRWKSLFAYFRTHLYFICNSDFYTYFMVYLYLISLASHFTFKPFSDSDTSSSNPSLRNPPANCTACKNSTCERRKLFFRKNSTCEEDKLFCKNFTCEEGKLVCQRRLNFAHVKLETFSVKSSEG